MIIAHNFSLKDYNTFGLDVSAKTFVSIDNEAALQSFLWHSPHRHDLALLLGGGSNMLLTRPVEGTVLHVAITGKQILEENDDYAIIEAGAGENWHALVLWAIEHALGGIENLSLIPGNIGTAPIQNIGAYGVELKDTFHSLDAIDIKTAQKRTFSLQECNFGYRESVFKTALKNRYIITKVRLKLKKPPHRLSVNYGAITAELDKRNISSPTIKDISDAVIAIRQSKLPDPKVLGNSGSFFKNPVVTNERAEALKRENPTLPEYDAGAGLKKIAAGWLIEQCGLKGYRQGDAGVHALQALVLVNYGSATGNDILTLANYVITSVYNKFGITLEPEVNIIS